MSPVWKKKSWYEMLLYLANKGVATENLKQEQNLVLTFIVRNEESPCILERPLAA
jgi:hypothetical protein